MVAHRFIPVIMLDVEFHSASVHTKCTIGWALISVYLRQRAVGKDYYMYCNQLIDKGHFISDWNWLHVSNQSPAGIYQQMIGWEALMIQMVERLMESRDHTRNHYFATPSQFHYNPSQILLINYIKQRNP